MPPSAVPTEPRRATPLVAEVRVRSGSRRLQRAPRFPRGSRILSHRAVKESWPTSASAPLASPPSGAEHPGLHQAQRSGWHRTSHWSPSVLSASSILLALHRLSPPGESRPNNGQPESLRPVWIFVAATVSSALPTIPLAVFHARASLVSMFGRDPARCSSSRAITMVGMRHRHRGTVRRTNGRTAREGRPQYQPGMLVVARARPAPKPRRLNGGKGMRPPSPPSGVQCDYHVVWARQRSMTSRAKPSRLGHRCAISATSSA